MSFPTDERLKDFDDDDRIYVATALASEPIATLVNAVDSDYSHQQAVLRDTGLRVLELCPSELKPRT